jgi:hypothetical protein
MFDWTYAYYMYLIMKLIQFVFTEFLKSALAENLTVEDIEVSSSLVRNKYYFILNKLETH